MANFSPHQGWNINEEQREVYRQRSKASSLAKKKALSGKGIKPVHSINVPKLNPEKLMPPLGKNGLRALSLFSGCGGLDLGFERGGFSHVASYDLLPAAGITLRNLRPHWQVFAGVEGDVKKVDWRPLRGLVDIIHGGPPCQPFSIAGRQKGKEDSRDMFPEFVRAVLEIEPLGFVAENVVALGSKKFGEYVKEAIESPLEEKYKLTRFILTASDFGVPQIRKRLFIVGFRDEKIMAKYRPPLPTHYWHHLPTDKSNKPVQLNLFDDLNSPEK
ncbi:MAG: DNA (cytosine-5-)-methyltransferase, partial [Cyanobacteriota bacterium]|nr:DNA (cytosine-5-)-methyltransferase [Cyanobacteriota bacterium]